jgi:hypothetical protein
MINLIDWAQADALMIFMVAVLVLLPLVIVIWLAIKVKNSKK